MSFITEKYLNAETIESGLKNVVSDENGKQSVLIIIPHELRYGANGYPPLIPSSATPIFDVELIDF